jgi:hypothetical protein
LIEWVRDQVRASGDVPHSTALELEEILKRVEQMSADDTRTGEAWKKLRDAAPKVWEATKPVIDTVIGEAVKRALGL